MEYTYDDRGFRLSSTSFKGSMEEVRTWYIRDAAGQLLSLYTEDLIDDTEPVQTEVPIYGSGRLGLYRPQSLMGQYQYELTDHLGNVRAVIGEGTTLTYLATMETERDEKEKITEGGYFSNIKSSPTSGSINHTPGIITVDDQSGETETIDKPNEVVRINNARGEYPDPIGAGIMLPVSPGDVVNMEVFAKYANFDKEKTEIIPLMADYLISAFSLPTAGENWVSIFDVVNEPKFATMAAQQEVDEGQPRAFLNYILYDKDFNFEGMRLDQVSEEARIPETNPDLHSHEKLALEVTIQEEGFIYIYVSNDDKQDMDVYFDDLRITHHLSDVVAGADYYPFGLKMAGREITRENFRFGYQGQFAEEDEETGWNSFELRMYDPVIGRWMLPDPVRQYWSPYIAMGNNPVNMIDPDGGTDNPFGSGCNCIDMPNNGQYSFVSMATGNAFTFGENGTITQIRFMDVVTVMDFAQIANSVDAFTYNASYSTTPAKGWNKIMLVSNGHMYPGQQIGEPPGREDVVNVIQDFGMGLPGNAQRMPRQNYNRAKNFDSFIDRILKMFDAWAPNKSIPDTTYSIHGKFWTNSEGQRMGVRAEGFEYKDTVVQVGTKWVPIN